MADASRPSPPGAAIYAGASRTVQPPDDRTYSAEVTGFRRNLLHHRILRAEFTHTRFPIIQQFGFHVKGNFDKIFCLHGAGGGFSSPSRRLACPAASGGPPRCKLYPKTTTIPDWGSSSCGRFSGRPIAAWTALPAVCRGRTLLFPPQRRYSPPFGPCATNYKCPRASAPWGMGEIIWRRLRSNAARWWQFAPGSPYPWGPIFLPCPSAALAPRPRSWASRRSC